MEFITAILNSKLQKKLLRTLVLSLLCAGFAFQFPLFPAIAEKIPDEILAGVHRNFPPQYSLDEKTGQPMGFAIDIMDEVARRAGLKIRYVIFDEWPPLIQALKEGRIDIIPNMGIVEGRNADMDFTSPVEAFDINIFVRNTTTDIQGINDLQGRKVAVVRDNKGLFIIKEYGKAKPVIFNSLDEALLSLLSGNTDALVYPRPPVLLVARKSQLAERIKTVGGPLIEVKRAIAVGKGKTDLLHKLDTAVKELIPTPEYKKIYNRWHGTPEPYWNALRVLILAGVILVLVIVIFTGWHYLSLRRLNRDLKYSLEEQKKADSAQRESEKEARHLAQENELIAEIGRIISSTLDIEEVYERFAEKVRESIPFDIITINIVNIRDNTRTIRYHSGMHIKGRKIGNVVPLGGSVTEKVVRTRSSLLINVKDKEELLRQYPGTLHTITAGIQSMMGIPLISKQEVIGAFLLRSVKPDAYTAGDMRLAERLGYQIAGAVANAQLFLDLKRAEEALRESENGYRELSIVDDLTQLYNSRHFYNQLRMEIDRVNRYGEPLTLLLLDLDDFKAFNDTYGHVEGDQVLRRFGQVFKGCLRQTDSAYRYGGEEFTILMPVTTSEEAVVTSERIRTECRKVNLSPAPDKHVHLTVSIGLAQYKPQEDIKAFVHRVDQLMYTAKKNGKDRVYTES